MKIELIAHWLGLSRAEAAQFVRTQRRLRRAARQARRDRLHARRSRATALVLYAVGGPR